MEKYIQLLDNVKAHKANVDLRFKRENKKEAFGFNFFDFFKMGENKVSSLLAFLLNPNGSHGQEDTFLKSFFEALEIDYPKEKFVKITCEKVITNNRRIDILIQFDRYALAIENKIWASDQNNQLLDYNAYLDKRYKGKYHLLYLNPYGSNPNVISMETSVRSQMINEKKLFIRGYTEMIIPLLNRWELDCEAPRVVVFIAELKSHFKQNFIGTKSNPMTQELKQLIYNNKVETQELVSAYQAILEEILKKHEECSELLNNQNFEKEPTINVRFIKPFMWYGNRVSKFEISRSSCYIYIQLVQEGIELYPSYYTDVEDNVELENAVKDLNLVHKIDYAQKPIEEIVTVMLNQVNKVIEVLK